MNQIDWSLAPEGATHWNVAGEVWCKVEDRSVFYWKRECWIKSFVDFIKSEYIPRPTAVVEIDWSRAPEGTTHYRPKNDPCWYKVEGGKVYYRSAGASWHTSVEFEYGKLLLENLIARPAEPWNGEGEPPVGTVCEWLQGSGHQWERIEILANHGDETWIKQEGKPSIIVSNIANLRPLRTPEQIAEETRAEAVKEMLALDTYPRGLDKGGMMSRTDFCKALYDAGFRKPEETS